ncbi:hypothetical protein VOLCADRAFT_105717 [Volvox carteri f. nagariensis]|uniref:Uncharacterized protein n=1 Tax=Volvox carteri f. nagariensis TaxID=3068 RepID=D8U2J7_VOLCA|nr:uncharacterized protein VOLCADRAFT_105717 [Volvox carteri f. nagariensis]EFJ46070.1 hypothetical protein VOLCADRAFT_105717 [Volvox carteri f. nagariensis]|eukprot:XP_002952820.1 hypothetical protein VOLCADRAFT_105717 [Volvox carteri f. nagariensis]
MKLSAGSTSRPCLVRASKARRTALRSQAVNYKASLQNHRRRILLNRASTCSAPLAPSDVFVLDFDGVVVDSEPEASPTEYSLLREAIHAPFLFICYITASAFEAAALRWPHLFSSSDLDVDGKREQLRQAMRLVRPVLVRGFESMVMLRLLHRNPSCPATQSAILHNWTEELPRALGCWGESPEELNQVQS